jgi:CO dehydrogenase/acetyl-CoA synthase gamma subunit (corrinoid Fe-S protein)
MPLSVVDRYRDILPRTNGRECGYAACMAFASMAVSEKLPLKNCPRLKPDVIEKCQKELDAQYTAGKWPKRERAQEKGAVSLIFD